MRWLSLACPFTQAAKFLIPASASYWRPCRLILEIVMFYAFTANLLIKVRMVTSSLVLIFLSS
jgi:hypothetical protein